MQKIPEWSDAQISLVRRLAWDNKTSSDIAVVLGEPFTAKLVRRRVARYGITIGGRRMHLGTTKLAMLDEVC